MKLSLTENSAAWSVSSYSDGQFSSHGQSFTGSHFFYPKKAPQPWGISSISQLDTSVFTSDVIGDAELIIIGTGKTLVFPDDDKLLYFYDNNIGFEIMDTAAACRTWNILLSEDRNVVAALIPV